MGETGAPLRHDPKGMVKGLDGISTDAGASSARRQHTAVGGLGPCTSLLMALVLALSLGALSTLVMFPAAQHLRSLQDGERARATLHTSGACMAGQCQVRFVAEGRTVVADLPVGSGGGKNSAGTRLTVRYKADDPQVVAREEDVGGGGAALLAAISGGGALIFLAISVVAAVFLARRRRSNSLTNSISVQEGAPPR
ncbi:DUF3592 domain-containing protein [Streptomyces sp. NPDC006385]|uniref:DUF3592 domain-containing protein n=1 Tax=Streptomyces sp. NPDC006385 TaxID=3156761 RepID=UPI0033B02FE8